MLFGILKCLWGIFSETCKIEERYFEGFFDIVCGLTIIDILNPPLNMEDETFTLAFTTQSSKKLRRDFTDRNWRMNGISTSEENGCKTTQPNHQRKIMNTNRIIRSL